MSQITDTLTRWLEAFGDASLRWSLRKLIEPLWDAQSTRPLTNAGLAIKAGGSAVVKLGSSDFYALANGVLVKKAASTDMAALSGTVTNATFNVFAFFIDNAGTLTSAMGTQGATLGAVVFPPMTKQKACIGFVIINPTGTGDFAGGTTALDDATVVPNAVYVNALGGFNPAALIGGA